MGLSLVQAERLAAGVFNNVGVIPSGVTTVTASAVLTDAEAGVIVCNAASAIALTLPAASAGKVSFLIVNIGAAAVTFTPAGSDTVNPTSVAANANAGILSNGNNGWGYISYSTALYLGLFTAQPVNGAGGTEANYTGYARVPYNPSIANWGTIGATAKGQNALVASFPDNTGAAETVVGYGLFDTLVGGNMVTENLLASPQTLNTNAPISFAINALGIAFIAAP